VFASYTWAIALLTVSVMVVSAPFAAKSARAAAAMKALQPEVKALQRKFDGDKARLNQEVGALYRTHGVHPASGCLASLIPLPIFYVLYRTIGGLSSVRHVHGRVVPSPMYISHTTRLYGALVAAKGHLPSLGIDLAKSALAAHGVVVLAYWAIVGLVVLVQFIQSRRLRQQAPRIEGPLGRVHQLLPWTLVAIAAVVPAAVNVYFVVSGVCRVLLTYAINSHLRL
jgi:YidC/Oxa1 family membrane protein insertase